MSASHVGVYRHAMPLNAIIERRQKLASRGRPRKFTASAPKEKRSKRGPYNRKPIESRGLYGREPRVIKSFWTENTMDQVLAMTQEELDLVIDKYLDEFANRQIKNDKRWNWPILQVHVDARHGK